MAYAAHGERLGFTGLQQSDRLQVARGQRRSRVAIQAPDAVPGTAGDLAAERGRVAGRHVVREVLGLRDAIHREVALGQVDPMIGRDRGALDLHVGEQDAQVAQSRGAGTFGRGTQGIDPGDEVRQRCRVQDAIRGPGLA